MDKSDNAAFFMSAKFFCSILSLSLFLLLECAIFRSGWYNKYLEPNSTAGKTEAYLHWLASTPPGPAPEILVLGDSRIQEGFSTRQAGETLGGHFHFWNLGIGGSTPRVWYYLLRDADPARRRFKAIVVGLDYTDEDTWDLPSNRFIDLNFVIGRLRLTDCLDFARSMKSRQDRDQALAGCIFKGVPLRRDVREFLSNIPDRIRRSAVWRKDGLFYTNDYRGRTEDLRGLTADFAARTISFPPGLDAERQRSIESILMPPPAPQTGDTIRYRELWLGRILDLYRSSSTKIVFVQVPATPVPRPSSVVPGVFLRHAIQSRRASVIPENEFRDLEQPQYFFDGQHLNHAGRERFSSRLANTLASMLGSN